MKNSDKLEYFFSKNLKKLRKSQNLTLVELSKATKISKSTLSDYENEKSIPSLDVIMDICHYFNVSFEEIANSEYSEFAMNKKTKQTAFDSMFENEMYKLHLNLLNQKVETSQLQIKLLEQLIASREAENKTLKMNILLLEQKLKFMG
jgi:transcriptional regulator with XRE-family HTH domain